MINFRQSGGVGGDYDDDEDEKEGDDSGSGGGDGDNDNDYPGLYDSNHKIS